MNLHSSLNVPEAGWVRVRVSNKGEFIAGSQIERVIIAGCTKKEDFYY